MLWRHFHLTFCDVNVAPPQGSKCQSLSHKDWQFVLWQTATTQQQQKKKQKKKKKQKQKKNNKKNKQKKNKQNKQKQQQQQQQQQQKTNKQKQNKIKQTNNIVSPPNGRCVIRNRIWLKSFHFPCFCLNRYFEVINMTQTCFVQERYFKNHFRTVMHGRPDL